MAHLVLLGLYPMFKVGLAFAAIPFVKAPCSMELIDEHWTLAILGPVFAPIDPVALLATCDKETFVSFVLPFVEAPIPFFEPVDFLALAEPDMALAYAGEK